MPRPKDKPSTTPVADPTPHRDGQTTPHRKGKLVPRLPHERDESADSQAQAPDATMLQAHEDLSDGLQDTDRGPVMDEVYENQVRPNATPQRGAPSSKPPRRRPGPRRPA